MMDDAAKKKVLARLRRIAGQVEGIARMIARDRYCVDILLRIVSAQAAVGQAGKLVPRTHVETCVSEAMEAGKPVARKQRIDELMEVSTRYGCVGGRSAGVPATDGPQAAESSRISSSGCRTGAARIVCPTAPDAALSDSLRPCVRAALRLRSTPIRCAA